MLFSTGPKVTPLLSDPQQSRQFCDMVGELTWYVLRLIAIVADSKSCDRLFFYLKGKVEKNRKDLSRLFLEFGG